jgi:hypothetical protein
MKTKGSRQPPEIRATPLIAEARQDHRLSLYLSGALVLLAALAILATWAVPKQVGDLFVALAGGRDVAAGHLGQLDDWSCLTTGRVWINQNWLSHLLIYLSWKTGGPIGLLVFKAALLTAMAILLCLLTLRHGCTWPVAILLSAGLTMSCSQFVQLRANLLTLVMIPLLMWLLHRSIEHRHRIWWVLPVLFAWANLHGGFVFGLGMVGLWAICMTVQDWLGQTRNVLEVVSQPMQGQASCPRPPNQEMLKPAPATTWPLWVCAAGCVAVAAISPFGPGNLSHPLVIAFSKAWRQVPEWRPLLESPFTTPWAFFFVLGLAAALAVLRLLALAFRRPIRQQGAASSLLPIGPLAFDGLLAILVVVMAFRSQRFVPLAILVLAAPLASLLAWLVGRFRRSVTAALAACVCLGLVLLARQDLITYWPANPVHRGVSVFERMHYLPETFPVLAAQFLADNHLDGNVLCEWEWEGYLRWVCPSVKPLIGGRAQQVFSEDNLATYSRLFNPRVGPDWLRQYQVPLAVLSLNGLHGRNMISLLVGSDRWACVYDDGQTMVLVDTQANSRLVQQALAGELKYPSEPIKALSQTLCLATQAVGDPADIFASARRANAVSLDPQAYMVVSRLGKMPGLRASVIQYLEEESTRLSRLSSGPADRLAILRCRLEIQSALAELYRGAGQPRAAQMAKTAVNALSQEFDALQAGWD